MSYFTKEDHNWFKKVQENKDKYKIVIDNDCIWVENIQDIPECMYTFNSYGYEFVHALLNDMGINAEFC